MRRNIIIVSTIILIILISIGGYAYYKFATTTVTNNTYIPKSDNTAHNSGGSIPLNYPGNASENTEQSLSVKDASPLGQQSTLGESRNGSTYSGPDVSTFSEYNQYKDSENALFADIVVGKGSDVKSNSRVSVYYKGWLTDGKLFDQSRNDKNTGKLQPLIFTIGAQEIIQGFEQGVIGMKVGGIRRIIVPPAVGYGAKGNEAIPPNAVMVFEVEVVNAL